MIAAIIKNGRLARGLTQKELAEQTNISIRSIQRIENATLLPRSYTLKTIAGVLEIPFADLVADVKETETEKRAPVPVGNKPRQIIFSIFIPLLVLLAGLAFISQSAGFPETSFEAFVFWGLLCLFITAVLYFIWQPHKTNE